MNVLITGYEGFFGRNLIEALERSEIEANLLLYDRKNSENDLKDMCSKCDFTFHLAAVVRTDTPSDYNINTSFTKKLLNNLKEKNNRCPIMFASSIQAVLDNPYAECKRKEENMIFDYGRQNDIKVFIFRFPNLFGRYSRPNYTSVISTFCYNTSHNLPFTVNNPSARLNFVYVNDVLEKVIELVFSEERSPDYNVINIQEYSPVGLGELSYYMETLKQGIMPQIHRDDSFYEKLKVTYEWFEKQEFS